MFNLRMPAANAPRHEKLEYVERVQVWLLNMIAMTHDPRPEPERVVDDRADVLRMYFLQATHLCEKSNYETFLLKTEYTIVLSDTPHGRAAAREVMANAHVSPPFYWYNPEFVTGQEESEWSYGYDSREQWRYGYRVSNPFTRELRKR